jgi:transposase-like protein
MIPCPRCGGTNASRHGRTRRQGPVLARGVVIRHFRCGDCSLTFHTFEIAVRNREMSDAIMDAIDAAEGVAA